MDSQLQNNSPFAESPALLPQSKSELFKSLKKYQCLVHGSNQKFGNKSKIVDSNSLSHDFLLSSILWFCLYILLRMTYISVLQMTAELSTIFSTLVSPSQLKSLHSVFILEL